MSGQPDSKTPASPTPAEKQGSAQFVGFQIDDQEYALRIEQIQEIVILDRITRTPQSPDYVEGVSNLRGSIIPIINLRKLLGLEPKPAGSETRTIVVNVGDRTMGCTVDMVSQVIRVPVDGIQKAPDTITGNVGDYIIGFAKIDERLLIVLDIEKLLETHKLDRVRIASE